MGFDNMRTRFIESIKSKVYGPGVVFAEQFMYGNIEIIREFFGIGNGICLKGSLQHGWFYGESLRQRNRIFVNGREMPDFIWSRRVLIELNNLGFAKRIVIGSPWAHLVTQKEKEGQISRINETKTLLYVPSHSYPGWVFKPAPYNAVNKLGNFNRIALLSWLDFLNPTTRNEFERQGYVVDCVGYRGSSGFEAPWIDVGGRSEFLKALFNLISGAQIVVVDEISSPFWYALSLRKPVIITRNEVNFKYWNKYSDLFTSFVASNTTIARSLNLQELTPEAIIEPSDKLVALAKSELGFEFVGNAQQYLLSPKYTFVLK